MTMGHQGGGTGSWAVMCKNRGIKMEKAEKRFELQYETIHFCTAKQIQSNIPLVF